MSYTWLYKSIFLTILIFQFSYSINSLEGKEFDLQRTYYLLKNVLLETNPNDQIFLLNQLREYLNRMCLSGYFGLTHAHACQRIVQLGEQLNKIDEDNTVQSDEHGIQKRFFCNGFIGCKNAGR